MTVDDQPVKAAQVRTPLQRIIFMTALVIAGEAIFALPFHVARFFRPTVLSVLELSNTKLGAVQAAYGVTAMLSYFPGGPLADKFEARKLIVVSLLSTAAGGVYFATFPPYRGLWLLFGFWGITTILLFWAALIRATRDWGGKDEQGRAYGILDGGRGLLAAAMATGAALIFQRLFPADMSSVTPEHRQAALRAVIYSYAAVAVAAAVLVWLCVPSKLAKSAPAAAKSGMAETIERIRKVVRIPAVWLQALIIVSAYVAYKGSDNYSLYAHQVYGMNEVEVGFFTTLTQWIRPAAALAAGFVADRVLCSRVVAGFFATLVASYLYFAMATPVPSVAWILWLNVSISCVAIFGLRGVYFALFEEAKVPMAITGTAVGLVSVIGYTPDIFVSLVGGILLDRTPGVGGHQHFFWFLAGFALLGLIATLLFQRVCPRPSA